MICFTADDINLIEKKRQTHTVLMARLEVRYEGKNHLLEIQYWMVDQLYYVLLDDRPVYGKFAERCAYGFSDLRDCCAVVNECFYL